jgi:hypothetical protein
MFDVSGRTLMMAIQAVDAEMQRLRADIAGDDDDPDLHDLLLSYGKAAAELKDAYLDALKRSSNLPGYETLVQA